MHDPELFQKETVKAIKDLQETFGQTLSRQLALGAALRAIVGQLPLAALVQVQEEYEAEVDHQAALLPPKFQRPEFWTEWSDVLEARRIALQQATARQTGAG